MNGCHSSVPHRRKPHPSITHPSTFLIAAPPHLPPRLPPPTLFFPQDPDPDPAPDPDDENATRIVDLEEASFVESIHIEKKEALSDAINRAAVQVQWLRHHFGPLFCARFNQRRNYSAVSRGLHHAV